LSMKNEINDGHHKMMIGWREWIALPDFGIPAIKVKIDTGARTSAIHVFDVKEFESEGRRMVRFGVHPLQKNKETVRFCEAPLLAQRTVKNSGGNSETRYVVQTSAHMGKVVWQIMITLTNRDLMRFRMLLGRKALEKHFVIHPGRSFITGRSLAKVYQHEMSKRK